MQENIETLHWQFDINCYELGEKDRQLLREILETYFNYIAVKGILVTEKISREDLEEINTGRYEQIVSWLLEQLEERDCIQLRIYHWPMKQRCRT